MQKPKFYLFIILGAIAILSLVFIRLMPFQTSRMEFKQMLAENDDWEDYRLVFHDMNGDGLDDQVRGVWTASSGTYGLLVIQSNDGVKGQWNILVDSLVGSPRFFIGNYDHDSFSEIYVLYPFNNQIFLDIIFPYDEYATQQNKRIWVDSLNTIPPYNAQFFCDQPVFCDLTGDHLDEVVFSIIGQYRTYYPRKLYSYNLKSGSFQQSDQFGSMINNLFVIDHEGDGHFEITGTCGAPDNNQPGYEFPLPDSSSWLMVFNDQLKLIDSTPHEFPGHTANIYLWPFASEGRIELHGIWSHLGAYDKPDLLFKTKDLNTVQVLDTIPLFDGKLGIQIFQIASNSTTEYIAIRAGRRILWMDEEMKIIRTKKLDGLYALLKPIDLDEDGIEEVIIVDTNPLRIRVFDLDGVELVDQDFSSDIRYGSFGITNFLGEKLAFINSGNQIIYFKYQSNPWYYLRWLTLSGIIACLYFVALISLYLQKRSQIQKSTIADKMRKLELASIKAQLDPHFTFNALNVLNYLSSSGDQKGVEQFTHHFSKMLRKQLEGSDKPAIKLSEELDFVSSYIELQKLRFDIPINYYTDIDSKVDQNLLIPKMLIHTHVENAIKHGLLSKPTGGNIWITAEKIVKDTQISIRDDGFGRNNTQSSRNSDSNGKGLKILEQLIDLFYQLYKIRITQEFIDLKDQDGLSNGTKIILTINP